MQIILSDDDEKHHHRNFQAVSISGKVRTDGRTRKVSSWNFDRDSAKKLHKGFFSSRVTVLKKKHVVLKVYILLRYFCNT